MRYLALATDYDGTLAHDGRVTEPTLAGLERLRASGRKLLLVTGRELEDLQKVCSCLEMFEAVVAENGALLYRPATKQERTLCDPPPPAFVEALRRRGVGPISVGRVIVATWEPHQQAVLDTIRELGLELHVIFNKGAVMVLPAGLNKATGLDAALAELGLSPHNVVGVGDAENDHAFLGRCECAVAVANALPALKERADFVTVGDHGDGVVELIDELLADDLASRDGLLTRHHVLLGTRADGSEARLGPYGLNLLVAGSSGGGKSTLTTGLLERLSEHAYQYCVIDPEGDYETYEGAVVVGDRGNVPTVDQVMQLLDPPGVNVVVNLVGLGLADRPPYLLALLPRLQEMRAKTGRPHWLVLDETHHLLPRDWEPSRLALPERLHSVVQITVNPSAIAPQALADVGTALVVGRGAAATLSELTGLLGEASPAVGDAPEPGQVLLWERHAGRPPELVKIAPGKTQRRRHGRKYASGELPPDKSFYFHGPDGKLNLRAQNLILFAQLAEGVDEDTWQYHLARGDYAKWFRAVIKDEDLAVEAEQVAAARLPPAESRTRVREAIDRRYTLPATPPLPIPDTAAAPKHN